MDNRLKEIAENLDKMKIGIDEPVRQMLHQPGGYPFEPKGRIQYGEGIGPRTQGHIRTVLRVLYRRRFPISARPDQTPRLYQKVPADERP